MDCLPDGMHLAQGIRDQTASIPGYQPNHAMGALEHLIIVGFDHLELGAYPSANAHTSKTKGEVL